MVRNQLGLGKRELGKGLAAVLALLPEPVRVAFFAANEAYAALGVRYALVGGIAAGAYGEPRFTKDIDFLVGDEAFVKSGLVVSFAKPMPLEAAGVAIDPIPLPEEPRRHAHLEHALAHPVVDLSTGVAVPMLPALALAYMKLASPRGKDRSDIVAMLEAGAVELDALLALTEDDALLRERLEAARAEHEGRDD